MSGLPLHGPDAPLCGETPGNPVSEDRQTPAIARSTTHASELNLKALFHGADMADLAHCIAGRPCFTPLIP